MTQLKGSFKKYLDYNFLAGEDLTKDVQMTIKAVVMDEAFNGKTKEPVLALVFIETDRKVVMNKTNSKVMTKIAGSPNVEDWVGHKITLTAKTVSAFGKQVSAVRIKEDLTSIKV